ncbi:MAG: glycosyltransferase [Planctomycetaceae bacterium]|nr:glycosyltransferase [Planctomycetaceae bacterium]
MRGSEAAVGWHRAIQSAKNFDTWVICEQHEFADEIRQHIAAHGEIPGLQFVFVPIDQREWSWGQLHDAIWYAALRRWHHRAYREAVRLHEQLHFDLVHQVTFCGYREPGRLWQLGVPFLWGPVGGTQDYPWQFLPTAGVAGAVHEFSRSVVNRLQLRLSPSVRGASRQATAILAANSTVQRDFAAVHGVTPQVLLETGLANVGGSPRARDQRGSSLRILWSGLLTHRKALHLLLRALADLPNDVPYELRILGEGPLRERWQRLAKRLGIAPRISWLGRLPYNEALQQYAWADLFAFTSLRDTSGNVVLEALAAGVPVVCLDHQGVRDIVTERCGVKIEVSTPRRTIAELTRSIARLWNEPAAWEQLSRGAIARAKDFLWSRQQPVMADLYRAILKGAKEAPTAATVSRDETRIGNHSAVSRPVRRFSKRPPTIDHRDGCHASLAQQNPFGILMYHRVTPRVAGVPRPTWNVTPERFRRQLQGLLAHGWRPWPLRRALAGERVPPRTFVVTFDDGYDNVYWNAWPILRELSIPATVFVTTDYLDGDAPFPFDNWAAAGSFNVPPVAWRPLRNNHCAEMMTDGLIEIGSHTHTHGDLRGQPEMLQRDLARSIEVLRSRFGLAEVSFAFPFGHTGPDLTAAARRAGPICGLTADSRLVDGNADPFTWGRFAVRHYDTAATLAIKLDGWYTKLRDLWLQVRPWLPGIRADAKAESDVELPQQRPLGVGMSR